MNDTNKQSDLKKYETSFFVEHPPQISEVGVTIVVIKVVTPTGVVVIVRPLMYGVGVIEITAPPYERGSRRG